MPGEGCDEKVKEKRDADAVVPVEDECERKVGLKALPLCVGESASVRGEIRSKRTGRQGCAASEA